MIKKIFNKIFGKPAGRVEPSRKGLDPFKGIVYRWNLGRLFFMEIRYFLHIRFRKLHDNAFQKKRTYYKYYSKPYAHSINKASVYAFCISFVAFMALQFISPFNFSGKPRMAEAGSHTVAWDAQADFDYNAVSGGTDGHADWETNPRTNLEIQAAGSVGITGACCNTGAAAFAYNNNPTAYDDYATAVAVGSDGIYVGGVDKALGQFASQWRVEKLNFSGQHQWTYTNNISSTTVYAIAVGSDGIYVGGVGSSGWRVEKLNFSGQQQWAYNSLTNNGGNILYAIAVGSDGIYIGGSDQSTLGNLQLRVEKLNFSGQHQWTYTNNPTTSTYGGNEGVRSIAVGSDGLYIAGSSGGGFMGAPQWRVEKLNLSGQNQWSYVSTAAYMANSIAVGSDGLYVGGYDISGSSRWRVEKLNFSGQNQWTYNSNPSGGFDSANSIAVGSDGLYVGGIDISPGNNQWRVEKLNFSGQNQWTYTSNPSTGSDQANSIAMGGDGLYIAGYDVSLGNNRWRVEKLSKTFTSPGSLGGTGAADVGLRKDFGASPENVNFQSITSTKNALSTGEAVKFLVRTSPNKTNWTYYGRSGTFDVANIATAWTDNYFGQTYADQQNTPTPLHYTSMSASGLPSSPAQYFEILVRLESDGTSTPTLDNVTLTYNTMDAPQDTASGGENYISQHRADDDAAIAKGTGFTNQNQIKIKGTNLSGMNDGSTLYFQVELRPTADVWNDAVCGPPYNTDGACKTDDGPTDAGIAEGGNGEVTFDLNFPTSTTYKWRSRLIDSAARVSTWTEFNGADNTDFTVEQTAPSGGAITITDPTGLNPSTYAKATAVKVAVTTEPTDAGSGMGFMQFSNNGTDWGSTTNIDGTILDPGWLAYGVGLQDWNIPTGDEVKTVYARFRDNAGNISSKIFTSQTDWNGTTQGAATTTSQLDLTAGGDTKLESLSIDVGTGADGNYTLSSSKTIKTIYETDLGHGASSYNPLTGAVPNFNNFTITGTGILTTDGPSGSASGVKIEFKVMGTLDIQVGGKIDASGKGFNGGNGGVFPGSGIANGTNGYGNGPGIGGIGSIGTTPHTHRSGSGGGYGGSGGNGTRCTFGCYTTDVALGGSSYGYATSIFGSGGGGGDSGAASGQNGGNGGSGGGAVKVRTENLILNGNILANGNAGGNSTGTYCSGGGGGSGGSVYLVSKTAVNNANNISAIGGNGGGNWAGGGGGGGGQIIIEAPAVSGTPLSSGGVKGSGGSPVDGSATVPSHQFTPVATFQTSGTLGSTGTGLRMGNPANPEKYKWLNLKWNGSGIGATYKIKVQVRPADDWGNGDTGYVNPSDNTATWYEITSNSGTIPLSSAFSNTKTIETRLELVGDGANTPTLSDLTIESALFDQITLDQTAPAAFDISTPANNSWQTVNNPTLSWGASSDSYSGMAKYQLFIDGSLDKDNISNAVTSTTPTAALSDGTHTWQIKAVDNAGNVTASTSTWTVGIDTLPPGQPNHNSHASNESTYHKDNTGTYNVDFADSGSGLKEFYIQATSASTAVDQNIIFVWTKNQDLSGNTYTTDWSLSAAVWSAMQDGENYVWIKVVDNAARETVSSEYAFKVLKDTAAPTGGTVTINDGNNYTNDFQVNVKAGGATDALSGMTPGQMQFSNNGTDWGKTTNADGTILDAGWLDYDTVNHSWNLLAGGGEKTVYARFKDAAGNVSDQFSHFDTFANTNNKDGATTAIWDGTSGEIKLPFSESWTQKTADGAAGSPAKRKSFSMTYDVQSQKVVIFGGEATGSALLNDTWEWDGTSWTQKTADGAAGSPARRKESSMVYDTQRQKIVLFGGYSAGSVYLNDTWEWDGNSWTQRTADGAAGSPAKRYAGAMAYDTQRQKAVLFGGYNGSYFNDTWEWDGTSWTQKTADGAAGSPARRSTSQSIAYDINRQKTVLFGGFTAGGARNNDTWEWDGTSWTQKTVDGAAGSPARRGYHALAYNALSQKTFLFGGCTASFCAGLVNDTWEWDGTSWTQKTADGAAGSPARRKESSMAYDIYNQKVVLFGGITDSGLVNDTWGWGPVYTFPKLAQSIKLNATTDTIYKATLTTNQTLNGQTITYEMTANGGTNWYSVTPGVEFTIPEAGRGSDLRWRATLNSDGSATPIIQDINIAYQATSTDTITIDQTNPEITLVSDSLDPFSPSVIDTRRDDVSLNYTISDNVATNLTVTVEIFNEGLTLKRTLVNAVSRGQGAQIDVWNGKDDLAAFVSDGNYTYKVILTDAAGNSVTSNDDGNGSQRVTVDNTHPLYSGDLTYSISHAVKDADTLTVTANFNEDLTSAPTIAINYAGADQDLSATAMTQGANASVWSYNVNVPSGENNDGMATIAIAGTDIAGNALEVQAANNTFTVDNTAPVYNPTTLTYSINHQVKDADTLTVTANFSEDLANYPTIAIDFAGTGSDLTATNMTQGANASVWTFDINIPTANDGTATITIAGTDIAGNALATQATNNTFVVDNTAPGYSGDLTYSLNRKVRDADTQRVTAVFNEDMTDTPTIAINYQGVDQDLAATAMTKTSATTWYYDINVPSGANNDGTATITLAGMDIAGNALAMQAANNTFVADNTNPVYNPTTITYSINHAIRDANTLTVTANFSEDLADSPTVTIDYFGIGQDLSATAMSQGANASIWTYDVDVPAGNDGTATITIAGTDIAGNVLLTQATNNTFEVDNTAPAQPSAIDLDAADDTGYLDNDNITKNTSGLTLSASAEADSTVEVFDGVISKGTTTATGGTWTLDIDLTEGSHNVTVTATDIAGNVSSASIILNIIVDTTSPAVFNLTAPGDGVWIATNQPTLTWQQATDVNLLKYEVDIDAALVKTLEGGTLAESWQVETPLTEGTHPWYVTAYDKAGNTPTSTLLSLFNVQVDTNAPLAPTNIHANPQANENWKSTTTYTFTWDSPSNPGDVAPISDYCWKINSSGFTCLGSNAVTTGAQVLLGLNQGTNTFYVYAKDEAGNFNTGVTGSVAFQFDSLDPTSAVNMANTYYGPVANPTNLALLGTASDDKSSGVGSYSDLLKTEIKIQRADTKWYNFTAGSWDLGESADTLNNGGSGETWSYSLPISKLLSGVSYTVYSKATDNAAPANVQDAFAQDVFAWDDAAPTSLVSAFSGSYYSLPSKPASVTGTNSDTGGSNTSIVKIRIRDDQNSYWTGSGWGALTDLSATNTGTSFSTWSYDLSAVTWQQGKTYNFGVYGVDGVNNTETYHEDRSFIYDNTQAVISLTPADTFQDNTAITVNKAMADAESGIVTCLLEKKTGDLVSGATQNWGAYAQVDTTCDNSYSTTGLTAKAYKFKLTVTNGSGITNSTESGGIKIDTTAPMVDSFSYSDGFNTTGNFTVTKTESDPQSGIKAVELLEYFAPLNDNAVGEWSLANTITAGGNYSKTGAPSGAYKYEYRVQNNSNIWSNLSTSANIVKVDTALPAEVGSMAALGTDSTTIKVTWNLPVETHSGVSQFVIERTAKLDTYNANTDPTTYTYSALSKTINVSALPADVTYSAGTYAFMDTASGMTDQSWYAYRMKTIDRAGNDSGYIYDGTPTSADNYKAGKTNTPPAVSNLVLTPNGNLTPPQTINISFDVTDPDYLDVYNDLDSFFNPTGGLIQVRVLSGQGTEVMGWTNASRSPITDGYSAVSSYSFPSGAPYGTYTVAVKAVDSVGVYPRQSGTSTATFTYQPEPVTNIAAIGTDQNSAVNLTWTAPRTNSVDSAVTGIEKYVVERKIDADGESYGNAVDVLANSANHQGSGNYLLNDQGLTVLQYYKYRVKTVDVSGNSSGWVETSNSVTVPDTSAPSSVDDLIVSSVGSNGTSVNLSWTVPADNSDSATEPTIQSLKGVQQFKVYRRTADTNFVSGDLVKTITKGTDPEFSVLSTVGSPITLVDTGLTEATAYYYLVTVLDKALPEGDAYNPNESTLTPTSNQNSATLTTLTVPKNVQTKSASSDSNGRVIVYWQALDANYNNAPLAPYDFDAYIIERQVEGEGWNASYQTITDFARNYYIDEGANISNLSLNYTYRVKVRNANGNVSEVSSQTTIRPADVGDTTKPVITFDFNNVTKTPSSITIPFTTDEAVFGVVEYGTVSNNLDQTKSTGLFATSHSIVLSNLNSDTDYFFRIKAIDGSGNTETKLNNEVPYQITTDIDNGAPTNPDAGNGYGDQQKSNQLLFGGWFNIAHPYFEWNAGTDINSAISGYYVYFGTNPNADPSLTAGILTSNEDAKRFEAGTSLTVTESLTSGQTYYLRIKTKDTSGNISATAKTLFDYKYDATLPDSKIYTPRNGDTVDSVSIAGTASDDHANINRVLVRIKRTQGQTITYWSGATGEWVDSENTWNLAAGLTNWTYSNGSLNWDMGTTYNIESKAYDNTENEQAAPDSISFTYGTVDRDAPIITFAAEALADANDTVGLEAGVTSVKIKWTTNEGADSAVLYRKEGESEYRKGNIDPKIIGQTSHEITLSGLTSDTKYFFKLRSDDASSNRAETEELNFTTVSLGISEPKVVTTSSSANITWTTNVNSSSQAEYQKQNSNIPSKIEGSSELSKDHSVVIKPLTPGRYSYKVKSIDNDNNIGESPLLYFEIPTADTNTISEPKTGKVEEKEITATSAKITWESTIATTSWIEYGTESAVYSMLSGNNDLAKSHIVELKNLTPGTLYYYRVKGADANEIEYVSPEYSFTATLKPQVSNIKTKNVSYYAATIFWETNVSTDTIMAFGKDESLGQRKGNQEVGKAHEIVLDNIEDNAQYFYQIISRDKHGNEVRSDVLNFKTPLDTRGPEINDIKIDLLPMGAEDEYAGVIISWNTDKDSSKQIEYGEGVVSGKYDFRTTEDQNASTGHTVIIRDLNPSSTYHFRIKATDKRGNQTNSQDFSFVTPTKEKSILQLIIKSLEETFSWVKNIGGLLKRS